MFVEGYHGSLGIQFWLSALTFLGGIIYWAVRGRRERCPVCKKSILIERKGVVIIDEPGGNSNYEKDPSSKKEANFTLCPSCGRKNIPDSVYCEGCGKKWT
ncbi:MAG: zinc-ribbon domain-containing protein [Candidatus Methanofastidiosa archaeon]|nr:zinc-ribbon domain-containing protein [Candidatus Methanofastidiosa archaeon]